jgi:sugar phosphate isomerase/epimerase
MRLGISSWTIRTELEHRNLFNIIIEIKSDFNIKYWEGAMSHLDKYPNPKLLSNHGMINIVGHPRLVDKSTGDFCTKEKKIRNESIEVAKRWIDYASEIEGLKVIKFNPGEGADFRIAVDSFSNLNNYAKEKSLLLLIENAPHKGPMANAKNILKLVKEVSDNNFGINLDLGNFEETGSSRLKLIEEYYPYSKFVEMKTKDSNGAIFTYFEELKLIKELGYDS